jgi:hypothetical protein
MISKQMMVSAEIIKVISVNIDLNYIIYIILIYIYITVLYSSFSIQ